MVITRIYNIRQTSFEEIIEITIVSGWLTFSSHIDYQQVPFGRDAAFAPDSKLQGKRQKTTFLLPKLKSTPSTGQFSQRDDVFREALEIARMARARLFSERCDRRFFLVGSREGALAKFRCRFAVSERRSSWKLAQPDSLCDKYWTDPLFDA